MAPSNTPDIIYTKVDEAPELASASFLPIIRKFADAAGIEVGTRDISLAGRIISAFPEYLTEARRAIQDELNILAAKLPNAKGVVVEGHSGRTILDWAETNKPDLIIMASHRPGMQDLLLGSTATHVVRHASCAVHVVR